MAATVTVNDVSVMGNKRVSFATVTFDSSYPTGGESVTAAQLKLSSVHAAIVNIKVPDDNILSCSAQYDVANSKILVYDYEDGTPAEAANTTDLASLSVNVVAFGN